MSPAAGPVIEVVAAIITDGAGRTLMVRKTGTEIFMQPGGKPEPGEEHAAALVRELQEELGLDLSESDLAPIGRFEAAAANEPGHRVVSHAFLCLAPVTQFAVQAEIAEARWLDPADPGVEVAPLSRAHFLPYVIALAER